MGRTDKWIKGKDERKMYSEDRPMEGWMEDWTLGRMMERWESVEMDEERKDRPMD